MMIHDAVVSEVVSELSEDYFPGARFLGEPVEYLADSAELQRTLEAFEAEGFALVVVR